MMSRFWTACAIIVAWACGAWAASAGGDSGVKFEVGFEPGVRAEAASGRIVVMLVREGSRVGAGEEPLGGPFWVDPQPMFSVEVRGLEPGAWAVIDDGATSFPGPVSGLAAGSYRAQAYMELSRGTSDWKREAGNMYSEVVKFDVPREAGAGPVRIALTKTTAGVKRADGDGVEYVSVRSELLSAFAGREVMLRAGVVLPKGFSRERSYAAVYEVPGFGGDDRSARRVAMMRDRMPEDSAVSRLLKDAFWIVLDPESPNGHHLFADSANNGPVGRALVEELIPALEARYPLVRTAAARLVRGHSSGGWSSVWLAVTYPEMFGAAWSTGPDPLDFRRFQIVDIYADESMYMQNGAERTSYRSGGKDLMTIRQENLMEEVMGPGNSAGQQWDSWQAVFGPAGQELGGVRRPAALFDARSGAIDRAVAQHFAAYDIGKLIENDPGRVGLIFKQRIRVIVGEEDNFALQEAVKLIDQRLSGVSFLHFPEGQNGYIKVLPAFDHSTVLGSAEARAIPDEMVEHLRSAGLSK